MAQLFMKIKCGKKSHLISTIRCISVTYVPRLFFLPGGGEGDGAAVAVGGEAGVGEAEAADGV